jgi:membrane fusion protein, multidrug efflux system
MMVLLLGGTTLWFAIGSTTTQGSDSGSVPSATPATVVAIDRHEITLWQEFSGRLEAIERVDLRPRVPASLAPSKPFISEKDHW